MGDDVNLRSIARGTPGFSGADLANLVNEAALAAARAGPRLRVRQRDMEAARDKVLMGVERRSVVLSELDRVNCAYHEAGHAVVAALLPMADPLHKVTIIPRGRAMGVTMQLPEADRHTYTKGYLETQVAVLMGGRVGRGAVHEPHDQRRLERHRARHRHRAAHGLRVGHVGAGHARLPQGRQQLRGRQEPHR